jgi:hypothetical protein
MYTAKNPGRRQGDRALAVAGKIEPPLPAPQRFVDVQYLPPPACK